MARTVNQEIALDLVLRRLDSEPRFARNVAHRRQLPAMPAKLAPLPPGLHPLLQAALHSRGLDALYTHQVAAVAAALSGQNVAVATPAASGKSLCYHLPVLHRALLEPGARALMLFPTKALAQDQLAALSILGEALAGAGGMVPRAGVYDGDTQPAQRSRLRESGGIILSNPDMLHAGILPQHPRWAPFFAGLRTVVVDEMHTYRGVFGSHVANVLRRLRRICRFYGSDPQFILTSATIGNPARLAEQLAEAPVTLVGPRANGAPQGERVVLLYNPPVIDESLALRRSNWLEAVDLGQELLARDVQTIIFAGSRLGAELVVTELQERLHDRRGVRGYRAGYLATERRQIEAGLRAGKIRGVVATSALELGIDIGRLDAALLIGYPGTVASTWQQLGRAGRRQGVSLGVLVAGASPLDQYLMLHPEYLFERSPEQALINPDNDVILANHLLCAAAELPFADGEAFGAAVAVPETLRALAEAGELFERAGRYYWAGEGAPAMAISLRSGSPDRVLIQSRGERGEPQLIGEIDRPGVAFLLYPGAIYLHGGETYLVEQLEWEQGIAYVEPVSVDYYTRPMTAQEVQVMSEQATQTYGGGEGEGGSWRSAWGDVRVTLRCTGYRQIRKNTHEVIGIANVELPEHVLDTTACWLELSAALVEELKAAGDWLSDPNEYGPRWAETRNAARARDGYRCQICNAPETPGRPHHVHHRVPLRAFTANPALRGDLPVEMAWVVANRLDNLVTLCPSCHHRAEAGVRLRSGLGGATNLLAGVAPLYLMCDAHDLGVIAEAQSRDSGLPAITIYEQVPAGVGYAQELYRRLPELLRASLELVDGCPCEAGCPACVGPVLDLEYALESKRLARALLAGLVRASAPAANL